jgi:hypothetical protein
MDYFEFDAIILDFRFKDGEYGIVLDYLQVQQENGVKIFICHAKPGIIEHEIPSDFDYIMCCYPVTQKDQRVYGTWNSRSQVAVKWEGLWTRFDEFCSRVGRANVRGQTVTIGFGPTGWFA